MRVSDSDFVPVWFKQAAKGTRWQLGAGLYHLPKAADHDIFTSEDWLWRPYSLADYEMKEVQEFCDELGFRFFLSTTSAPRRMLSLRIWPKQENE